MHISPTLLLLVLVIIVFSPSIQEWVTQGGSQWYRPYVLWLLTIIFVWWSVARHQKKQTNNSNRGEQADEL